MKMEMPSEKSRELNEPYMKPIIPSRETYDRIGKEEQTTKHVSIFRTNDLE